MNAAVLVVGPFGHHAPVLAAVAEEVPLLHLVPMPQLAAGPHPDWPHRALLAVHGNESVEHWATMAHALGASHPVELVWCLDDDHGEIAAGCADILGVPVLGAGRPAPGRAEADTRVRVLRSGGSLVPLCTTGLVRHPGTPHVLAEVETRAGRDAWDPAELRELLEPHVPDPFLGSVELRAESREVAALVPWRAGDGTHELLHGRGAEVAELASAAITGRTAPAGGAGAGPFRAVAALGTEASGTLVSIDGIERAEAVPGVNGVVRLFRDGERVGALSTTGDLLVRVAAESDDPAHAFAAAREALTVLTPTVDVPADFAGALDRMWF